MCQLFMNLENHTMSDSSKLDLLENQTMSCGLKIEFHALQTMSDGLKFEMSLSGSINP